MPTNTYNYSGGFHTFTVPTGVKSLQVTVRGASSHGAGGAVSGRLAVTQGQVLVLVCGSGGRVNSGGSGGASVFGAGAAGGNGKSANGGYSGGGYSAIRLGSTSGRVLCVAGGGGGRSGDGGAGGDGGGSTGQSGGRGNAGGGATGAATGGTQTQGGAGGTSSSGSNFAGGDPSDTALAVAGHGGGTGGYDGPGGGGGGGGWHPGGGGQGGSAGWAPGGGGAGGSNYVGSLTGAVSSQGTRVGAGQIVITWTSPAPATQPPNSPSTINPPAGTRTKAQSTVNVSVHLSDPGKRKVRFRLHLSPDGKFSASNTKILVSPYVQQDSNDSYKIAQLALRNLSQDTLYQLRMWAENDKGLISKNYISSSFYTNFAPTGATLLLPHDGYQANQLSALVFTWQHNDPDGGSQKAAEIELTDESSGLPARTFTVSGNTKTFTIGGSELNGNSFYHWRVRTQDDVSRWGAWSLPAHFFVSGVSVPPRPIHPNGLEAVDTGSTTTFTWKFIDPSTTDTQVKADIRYRAIGTPDWITRVGSAGNPGINSSWELPARLFQVGVRYEWQVRTYDSGSGGAIASDWSASATFIGVVTPGYLATASPLRSGAYVSQLGNGSNIAMVMTKGGRNYLGTLDRVTSISWNRIRDDISKCTIEVQMGNEEENLQLLRTLRSWQHEIKVFRSKSEDETEGSYVWEGPITGIRYEHDKVTITAQDVMVWAYRRAMRQGYSDAYPAEMTVVQRAQRILINAFAIDDPNVLPYLTALTYPDDAGESRVRPPMSSTSWEEVDDMAAKAGLDYTVVGRRIILNDTHRPIGKLPTMTDADFVAPLVVTEYGMNLATRYFITNGNGVYGMASAPIGEYGYVEMVSSAYGDTDAADGASLTQAAKDKLVETFNSQATRGIGHRYPAPLQVRVPDGTGIVPTAAVTIDVLVPGVWIPLRSTNTLREVSQWQKLDEVRVTETAAEGETVAVTMLPAPSGGNDDPDADQAALDEAD